MTTAAYDAQVDAMGRQVQMLVEIDIDRCNLIYSAVIAGTSGPASPTAAAGTNWTDPTNCFASDDARAIYGNSLQDDLRATDFDFAIPTAAIILGFTISVEGQGGGTAANRGIEVGLTKDGTALAGTRAAAQSLAVSGADGILTFGGASSMFGTTWTATEINATTFGVLLRASNTNTSQRRIDHLTVTVHYTTQPCTATDQGDGSRCYYSFDTCQVPEVYERGVRTWRFCLNHVPWPDDSVQVHPTMTKVVLTPQRVEPSKLLTYPERVTIDMHCDYNPPAPDHDKGAGFHNTARTGELFRNLFARNRNYVNRPLRLYRGFNAPGFTLADFSQVGPDYRIKRVEYRPNSVRIIAESPLADLQKRKIPFATSEDNTLQVSRSNVDTAFTVLDAEEYPDPTLYTRFSVYVEVIDSTNGNEYLEVTNRNTGTNVLTVVRGRLGSTAVSHAAGCKIRHVAFFGTDNGASDPTPQYVADTILDLLHWLEIDSADIEDTTFDRITADAWPDLDVLRIVSKPEAVPRLMQPIRESRGLLLFLDSAGKWALGVIGPDVTGTVFDEQILEDSFSAVEDEEDRATRVYLFYAPNTENPGEDAKDYDRAIFEVDADLESDSGFGDVRDAQIFDPWLDPDVLTAIAHNMTARLLTLRRYGTRTVSFDLELREFDSAVIGLFCTIVNSAVLDRNGSPAALPCIITGNRPQNEHVTTIDAIDTNYSGRFFRIGPNTMADDYDDATAEDKTYGYWGDTDNRVGDTKDLGYILW